MPKNMVGLLSVSETSHYSMITRPAPLLLSLTALSFLSLLFALHSGSVTIEWYQIWAALTGHQTGTVQDVILQLRLPRAATAFITGAMLALAGALMQVLLRNPLADPYILGISGGAAVGALGAMLLGIGSVWVSGFSFVGAMFSVALVFGLAKGNGSWTSHRILLTGVVIAAGWGAVISFLLAISPDQNLRGMLFWLMGDLSYSQSPIKEGVFLIIALLICLPLARSLNLLARGELQAAALGIAVKPLRLIIYLLASLLTATAVMLAGSVGFIGLIVPHMLRLLAGSDHRLLLPASVLLGGCLLLLADTLARTVLAPVQLPVGVLTAIIGVPVFLYLLRRNSG